MTGPLLRGLALINDLAVLGGLHGDAMVERFADRLTRTQRAEYEAGFLPGRWYEEDIQARLAATLADVLPADQVARTGMAVTRYHVNRAQRFLARLAGPRRLLSRSAGLWSYWRDTGRLRVEHFDGTSARVAVLDHPLMASPGYALFYGGASAYLVYLSGARNLRMHCDSSDAQRVVATLHWGTHAPSGEGFIDIDRLADGLPLVLPRSPRQG